MLKNLFLSTAIAGSLALAAFPATAQILSLGPSAGLGTQQVCDLISVGGGTIKVQCSTAKGLATFDGTSKGPYTLSPMVATFGPTNASGVLPAPADGSATQQLDFGPTSDGNQISGKVTWKVLSYQGTLTGSFTPMAAVGTAAFTAAFQEGVAASASVTLTNSYTPGNLLLHPTIGSGVDAIASGEILGHTPSCTTVTTCK